MGIERFITASETLDHLGEPAFLIGLDGSVIHANPAALSCYGYSRDEILALDVRDLRAPSRRESAIDQYREAAEHGKLFETVARRSDGTFFPAEVQAIPVGTDGETALLSLVRDITERKRLEEELARQRRLLERAESTGHLGAYRFEFETGRTTWSPEMFVLWGVDPSEFDGDVTQIVQDRIHPDDLARVLERRDAVVETRAPAPAKREYRLVLPDGTVRFIENDSETEYDASGAAVASLGYCLDVTDRRLAERELEESETRLREVLENSIDASYKRDLQTNTYDYLSPAFERISGYAPGEIDDLPLDVVLDLIHSDDAPEVARVIDEAMSGPAGTPSEVVYRFKRKDGEYRWLQDRFAIMRVPGDELGAMVGSVGDVTERREAEEALRHSEEKYRLLFESAGDAIFIHDRHGMTLAANPAACARLGHTNDELMSMNIGPVDSPDEALHAPGRIAKLMETGHSEFETVHLRKDGSRIPTDVSAQLITWNGQPAIMSTCRDITERKLLEEKLHQLATTDDLTGIPNRHRFFELAEGELKRALRHHEPMAIVFADIDHLKDVNDSGGHAAGDQALISFANVCKKYIREIDVLARLGGDEFALILPATNHEQAYATIERVRVALATEPIEYLGTDVTVSISAGVAELSGDQETLDKLLGRADRAMYRAKEAGRNRTVVDAAAD